MLLGSRERYLIRHEISFRPQRDQGAGLDLRSDTELDVIDVLTNALNAGAWEAYLGRILAGEFEEKAEVQEAA